MGLDAEVIAIGRFSQEIAGHLGYPADYYKNTHDGTSVITTVFEALTSQQSYDLAECFGIDAFDFNGHHLDPSRANITRLREIFDDEQVRSFLALRAQGFAFYFRPNA